ncbi:MAG TPA: 4Fe-4S dicluster domain-containing protein [Euryarchaeota archaeon]|nr:NADH dehydrogenase subunit I [archaeon BMS3Bbin15]HDL15987.1 4Fe-4S dicluster domain-containing protein [Euryarchaeota archaeon]
MTNYFGDIMSEDELSYTLKFNEGIMLFERDSTRENRRLIYDKDRCTGCGMCVEACPTKAVYLGPLGAINKGLSDVPHISIDAEKCVLCGICSAICLFNSINVEIDGRSVKNNRDFVNYEGIHIFNQNKCSMKNEEKLEACEDCMNACPRNAITFAGIKEVEDKNINTMERDEDKCVFCSACEKACPTEAIKVNKIFDGELVVDQEICQGCGSCKEICPTGAIYLPNYNKLWEKVPKVEVTTQICCFCSACEKVCPVNAITLKRSSVKYTKGEEKSWTKAWEKAFKSFVG